MNLRIAFRGMEHSGLLEDYVKKALEKTEKFLGKEPDPIHFDVVLEAHREHHHHKAEVRLNSKNNHVILQHEDADIYVAIDYVMKHLVDEIKKNKEKQLEKRNHCC